MIEVWVSKAWNGSAPARRKLAANALGFIKRLPSKRAGVVLTVTVPLLVIIWHLLALAQRPDHLNKIVSVLGSPIFKGFFQNPMPNHAGTHLLFVRSSEKGFDLYFANISDGNRKTIYEEGYKEPGAPNVTLLGWSPDDHHFAYCRLNKEWEIVICDGDTGDNVAIVPLNSRALLGAWLSPGEFAFGTENNVLFTLVNTQGTWSSPKLFDCFKMLAHSSGHAPYKRSNEPMKNLTAFDDNSIVWQQGNEIWRCDVNSEEPIKLWDSTTNTLIEFSYSQAAREFLLQCQDINGQFFTDFYPEQVSRRTHTTRINNEYDPKHLAFINQGSGYAFITQVVTSNALIVKLDSSNDISQSLWFDQIGGFASEQHDIFITGARDSGPSGIYRYNILSSSAECVVQKTEEDFNYLTNCNVERRQITNASGDTLTYYLYTPSHTVAKKHSLVIGIIFEGPTGFVWNANYEAFASGGNYYVIVERYNRNYSQWNQDVLTVYENLAQRPDVNTNRVYLFGVSGGAPIAYNLLESKPELWRGLVLYSPAGFPKLADVSGKSLFVDCAGSDPMFGKNNSENPKGFQNEAAKAGIPVTLLIHPGLGHSLRFPPAERERLREALIFLNGP